MGRNHSKKTIMTWRVHNRNAEGNIITEEFKTCADITAKYPELTRSVIYSHARGIVKNTPYPNIRIEKITKIGIPPERPANPGPEGAH